MRKAVIPILLIAMVWACKKESYLRLDNSDIVAGFQPGFTTQPRFTNGQDTILMELYSQSSSHERAPGTGGAGSLGDFDYLELERSNMVTGMDTPYFRFHFDIQTSYHPTSPSRSKDLLTIGMRRTGTANLAEMQLEYIDSVKCIMPDCNFQDTLMMADSTFYYNVYYLAKDSTEPALYLNSTIGLVGFKATDGKTYKRIN